MLLRLVVSVFVVVVASPSVVARAQDGGCGPAEELGPVEVTPSSGAEGVRVNSIVRVRYSAGYFEGASAPTESVELSLDGAPVPGRTQLAGTDTLYFLPDEPLEPNVRYDGTASGAVFPFDFSFRTIAGNDVANPDLRHPESDGAFRVASSPNESGCGEVGSRRIRLEFSSASDDGPRSSVEYWVYLTRAEGLPAPRLLARVRDYGGDVTTIGAVLSAEESASPACISLVAVDGLDRGTEWSSPACFDPQVGTGFQSLCTAGPRPSPTSRTVLVGMLAAALVLRLRRSRALTRASRS